MLQEQYNKQVKKTKMCKFCNKNFASAYLSRHVKYFCKNTVHATNTVDVSNNNNQSCFINDDNYDASSETIRSCDPFGMSQVCTDGIFNMNFEDGCVNDMLVSLQDGTDTTARNQDFFSSNFPILSTIWLNKEDKMELFNEDYVVDMMTVSNREEQPNEEQSDDDGLLVPILDSDLFDSIVEQLLADGIDFEQIYQDLSI